MNIDYSEYKSIKNNGKYKSLIGTRNGKIVITKLLGRKNRHIYYEAVCDCGSTTLTTFNYIKHSCGCEKANKGGYFKDISGQKFGLLTALERIGQDKNSKSIWKCQCDCGNVTNVNIGSLISGGTKSCGAKIHYIKHGATANHKTERLYSIYRGMKQRCYNSKSDRYSNYGKRGIIICDEWINSYETFRNWALSHGYRDDLTIDRIDVNGNYEPNNCRWATSKEQGYNKTNLRYIEHNGKTHCLKEWCEILGYNENYIRAQVRKNKDIRFILFGGKK